MRVWDIAVRLLTVVAWAVVALMSFSLLWYGRASAATGDTIVNLGPLWDGLLPYFVAGIGALITAIMGWAAVRFQMWTGMKIDENARNVVQSAASNGANLVLAEIGARAHATNFDVGNANLATGIRWMEGAAADSIKRLGVTPEKAADLVLSKVTEKIAAAKAPATVITPVLNVVETKAPPPNTAAIIEGLRP